MVHSHRSRAYCSFHIYGIVNSNRQPLDGYNLGAINDTTRFNEKLFVHFWFIAALILAGYYCAPIFFTMQRVWIVLVPCLFTIRKQVLVERLFSIGNFVEFIWNRKRKAWKQSVHVKLLKKHEDQRKVVFCSFFFFWESASYEVFWLHASFSEQFFRCYPTFSIQGFFLIHLS